MIKYPSIEQFRHVIKAIRERHDYHGKTADGSPIREHRTPYPTLTFSGRVKLHGTNAAVVRYADGRQEFQSRERVLTVGNDNAGFALAMSAKNLDPLFANIEYKEYCAVYGEWCGGNIQKGVALNGLPKMFVVFGYFVDGEWKEYVQYNSTLPKQDIYHVDYFNHYGIYIDFNNPELSQQQLIDWTLDVEKECPVGRYFGVKGIGEGIVFTCVEYPELRFKSKGELHSSSNVKTLNPIDVEELKGIQEFVEYAVTENRLKQGLEELKANEIELSNKNTGHFIKWVANDVLKEEKDTIVKNQIDWKKAAGFVAKKSKEFYFKNL